MAAGCGTGQPTPPAHAPSGEQKPAPVKDMAHVAGVYANDLPTAGTSKKVITLELKVDGLATMTTETPGKPPVDDIGEWSLHGDLVRLELKPREEGLTAPAPMAWTVDGAKLVPKEWDHKAFGEAGLPLQRKSDSETK